MRKTVVPHIIGENGQEKRTNPSFYAQKERKRADTPFPDRLFFQVMSEICRDNGEQLDAIGGSQDIEDAV